LGSFSPNPGVWEKGGLKKLIFFKNDHKVKLLGCHHAHKMSGGVIFESLSAKGGFGEVA